MSNVLNFPEPAEIEVISEEAFRKYTDAALLLKCFEVIKDTLDVINEPEYSIEKEDDTHIDLIRAFYALKVLFARKTGHDAAVVAQDHWEAIGRHLLEGAPYPDQLIPIAGAFISQPLQMATPTLATWSWPAPRTTPAIRSGLAPTQPCPLTTRKSRRPWPWRQSTPPPPLASWSADSPVAR